MISKATFFSKVRLSLFNKAITQKQVDGLETILNEWDKRGLEDKRFLAYILATTFHETAKTMQPIEEYSKGKGRAYGVPDKETGKIYYGRGYVQITWIGNYRKFARLLNIPLVEKPELALQKDIACQILFIGMLNGLFTGKKLSDYFDNDTTDWENARRIINGTDCKELIAGYAKKFYEALK
jgi:predicted chitinase